MGIIAVRTRMARTKHLIPAVRHEQNGSFSRGLRTVTTVAWSLYRNNKQPQSPSVTHATTRGMCGGHYGRDHPSRPWAVMMIMIRPCHRRHRGAAFVPRGRPCFPCTTMQHIPLVYYLFFRERGGPPTPRHGEPLGRKAKNRRAGRRRRNHRPEACRSTSMLHVVEW
jgi:hypothetical protein